MGGFFTYLQNALPISQLSLCSQERLDGARTQLGVTPAPPSPCPTGRKGLGRAPAPWQRVPGPGCWHSSATARACWQHLGEGAGWHISSIQCFCSSSRAASLGRAAAAEGAISRKKTHNHNPQTSAPGSAASPSPGGLSPGRSCWSSQMVPSGIEVKQSPLELPSTILSKEAE